jgi:peptidoglycan/LPS O-acetylase OafA/YrhL
LEETIKARNKRKEDRIVTVGLVIYYALIHLTGATLAIYCANRLRSVLKENHLTPIRLIVAVLYLFALGAPVNFFALVFQWELYRLYDIPSIFFVLFLIGLTWTLMPSSRWRKPLRRKREDKKVA